MVRRHLNVLFPPSHGDLSYVCPHMSTVQLQSQLRVDVLISAVQPGSADPRDSRCSWGYSMVAMAPNTVGPLYSISISVRHGARVVAGTSAAPSLAPTEAGLPDAIAVICGSQDLPSIWDGRAPMPIMSRMVGAIRYGPQGHRSLLRPGHLVHAPAGEPEYRSHRACAYRTTSQTPPVLGRAQCRSGAQRHGSGGGGVMLHSRAKQRP